MNPIDPDAVPPSDEPGPPKPWHKPQQDHEEEQNGTVDGGDVGSGAGDLAAGAADAAGEVAGAALEGASAALDVAGGCADGCSGCSLAILVTLFAATSTAMALFR